MKCFVKCIFDISLTGKFEFILPFTVTLNWMPWKSRNTIQVHTKQQFINFYYKLKSNKLKRDFN